MKKLLPLLALLALTGAAKAATVTGTITSATTCSPVSGQKVYVADSMYTWMDSTVTNSSGMYSITVPGSVGTTYLVAWANACSAQSRSAWTAYAGTNTTINLVTCGTAKVLNGRVRLAHVPTTGPAMVWLIRRDVNPTTFDTSLTAIDSMQTFGTGQFTFQYACIPAGTLLLKAALLPTHASYSSYLPSYRDSSLNWNGANPLNSSFFTGTWAYVDPKAGSNPGGPGFVGGSVLLGANKAAGIGDPLSGRTLILTTSAGQAVAYTRSDAAGKFQFTNLATGSYRLFGDVWGKYDPALTVNITATQTTVNNIIFEENDKKFQGRFANVGVGYLAGLPGVHVFPNPATDYVSVAGLEAINGDKVIVLRDITGHVVSRQTINKGVASINTSALPSGIYLLQVHTEAGSGSFQVVK